MPDILDQNEVDALLAAVHEGKLSEAAPSQRPEAPGVKPYDFKRPERMGKEQLRALSAIHEGFARNLAAVLSGYLRSIVEVRLTGVEQLTYSEFIQSLPNPTCFVLLSAEPLEGNIMLELSPSLTFPLIDRLLGGGKDRTHIPERPLTEIEIRILSKILDLTLAQLSAAWSVIDSLRFTVQQTESNPQLVQMVAPNESVVFIGIEISLGDVSEVMKLCIPFLVIEPEMGRLSSHFRFASRTRNAPRMDAGKIARKLGPAMVELVACLTRTNIKVKDLLALQVGDIIETGKPADSESLLAIEGIQKFRGYVGKHRGKKAFLITRKARPDEYF